MTFAKKRIREAIRAPERIKIMEENKTYETTCGCKHIKGIKCSVENCYYHDMDTCCTAKEIAVGPRSADQSGDTLCATFKPKNC